MVRGTSDGDAVWLRDYGGLIAPGRHLGVRALISGNFRHLRVELAGI